MKQSHWLTALASTALVLALASSPVMARSHQDKDKKASQYPNATRAEPKLDLTSEKEQKSLNEGLTAVSEGDKAKAEQTLQPIVDTSKSKYAKALALQGLATIHYNDGDLKSAIKLLQQSLAQEVIPNDTYFQLEYMLAQFQLADGDYQGSLDTVSKWRAEGKRETAESYALEGNDYYRLQKYPEAIAAIKKAQSLTDQPKDSWNQILMASYAESGQTDQAAQLAQQQLTANPNDEGARNNAVAVLMQAQKYPEAIKVMEQAHGANGFQSEKDYVNLSKLYLVSAQSADDTKPDATKALSTLEEGFGKGVVKPSYDNYNLMGEAAEMADNMPKAVDAYNKAMPLAKSGEGEAAVRGGHLLLTEQKYSQARDMVQKGIDKGVKHMGTAYMLLAECERGLKNKPAAIAAMKKAAQQPETASKAKDWLKKAGVSQ